MPGAFAFLLAAALGVFIVVECTLHAVGRAVKQIDRCPQQILKLGLKPGVGDTTTVRFRHDIHYRIRISAASAHPDETTGFREAVVVMSRLRWTNAARSGDGSLSKPLAGSFWILGPSPQQRASRRFRANSRQR
jgi:hypothetical protein